MSVFKCNSRRLAPRNVAATPVQNGLALTPSEMWRLQQQGLAISSQATGLSFDDGQYKADWDVPLEHRRGVDPADLQEFAETRRQKVNQAFNNIIDKQPSNV